MASSTSPDTLHSTPGLGLLLPTAGLLFTVFALVYLSEVSNPDLPAVDQVEFTTAASLEETPLEGWQRTPLPVRFCRVTTCKDAYEVLRVHFHVASPGQNWGIYLPQFESAAQISLNRQVVRRIGRLEDPVSNFAGTPVLVEFLPGQLQPGQNELIIHFSEIAWGFGKLGPFYVGPLDELAGSFNIRHFTQVTLLEIPLYLFTPALLFIIVFSVIGQADRTLVAFAFLLAFYLLRTTNELVVDPWLNHPFHAFMYYAATLGLLATAYSFVGRWTEGSIRTIERIVWSVALAATVYIAWQLSQSLRLGTIASNAIMRYFVLAAFPYLLFLIIRYVYQTWEWSKAWIAGALITTAAIAVFDVYRSWPPAMPGVFYTNLGPPLLVLAFALELAHRHAQSIRAVNQANRHLTETVQRREEELADNYARLKSIEHEHLLMTERQRIMRDMHDGVGGQLAALSSRLQRESLPLQQVRQNVRDSLQDLRLLIGSLDTVPDDVGLALGSLRPRLQSW